MEEESQPQKDEGAAPTSEESQKTTEIPKRSRKKKPEPRGRAPNKENNSAVDYNAFALVDQVLSRNAHAGEMFHTTEVEVYQTTKTGSKHRVEYVYKKPSRWSPPPSRPSSVTKKGKWRYKRSEDRTQKDLKLRRSSST